MTEDAENEDTPEVVAPMTDEDEPAELEELEPVDPVELEQLEHVDTSGHRPRQARGLSAQRARCRGGAPFGFRVRTWLQS